MRVLNVHSIDCKPKSWELNYPVLAFLLNGEYYADYATITCTDHPSIMDMVGLLVMHHLYNLVACVGMWSNWQSGCVTRLEQTPRNMMTAL